MNSLIQTNNLSQVDLDIIDVLHIYNSTVPLSDKSKEIYFNIGSEFNQFLFNQKLRLSADAVKQFLFSKVWSEATYNLKLSALTKLISAQTNDPMLIVAIKEAIRQSCKRVKINRAITKDDYLTESQVDDIISKCKTQTGFLIEFLFKTGCRISEAINARLANIRKSNGIANIEVVGKGNKQRSVFTDIALINEIQEQFQGNVYLFETGKHTRFKRQNLWKDIKDAGSVSGYEFIYPHIFRHSCAEHLKSKGKDVKFVQKYLGHASPVVTIEFYFHDQPQGDDVVGLFN